MFPTNNLTPWLRYPLAIIVALLAGLMFLGLMLAALKLGDWIAQFGSSPAN